MELDLARTGELAALVWVLTGDSGESVGTLNLGEKGEESELLGGGVAADGA